MEEIRYMKQKTYKAYAISAIAVAAVGVVMRIITALLFTEEGTGVYVRGSILPNVLGYMLASAILFFAVFAIVKKKDFAAICIQEHDKVGTFVSAVLGFMFLAVALLLLLSMMSQRVFGAFELIMTLTGIFSSVYYLARIFSREIKAQTSAVLSMIPIIWTMTALIEVYFDMSILITSPARKFQQLALIAFAIFLLAEVRIELKLENTLLYAPAAAASTILLAVTSIPSLIFPHTLAVGRTDRPIVYALELAAALYSGAKLYAFCSSTHKNTDD